MRVNQGEQPLEAGHHGLEELELLRHQIPKAEDAGQIAPRVSEAPDVSRLNGIDRVEKDDRRVRFRGRGLGLADRLVLERDDELDVVAHECVGLGPRGILVGKMDARDQLDVASLNPAQLSQTGLQRLE